MPIHADGHMADTIRNLALRRECLGPWEPLGMVFVEVHSDSEKVSPFLDQYSSMEEFVAAQHEPEPFGHGQDPSPRLLSWLKAGSPFTLLVEETGQAYSGKVVALGAGIDPGSQTLSVRGEVSGNFPELLPGLGGVARFQTVSP